MKKVLGRYEQNKKFLQDFILSIHGEVFNPFNYTMVNIVTVAYGVLPVSLLLIYASFWLSLILKR